MFNRWNELVIKADINPEVFDKIGKHLEEKNFAGFWIDKQGRISKCLRIQFKTTSLRKPLERILSSKQFKALEDNCFLIVNREQVELGRLQCLLKTGGLIGLIKSILNKKENKELIEQALRHGCIVIGCLFKKKERKIKVRLPFYLKWMIPEREIEKITSVHFIFRGKPFEIFPELRRDLQHSLGHMAESLKNHEQWIVENSVREYTRALTKVVTIAAPIIALAYLADHYMLPYLFLFVPAYLFLVKKIIEGIIRYLEGYTDTLTAWLHIEHTSKISEYAAKKTARRPKLTNLRLESKFGQEVGVYRVAVLATALGPLALIIATYLHLSSTSPRYVSVAVINACSDNFFAALTQGLITYVTVCALRGRRVGLGKVFSHPFFSGNLIAISLLALLDTWFRTAGQAVHLSSLFVMAWEAFVLGLGDSELALVSIKLWRWLKFLEVRKKLS